LRDFTCQPDYRICFSFGASSNANSSDTGIFNALDNAKTVQMVGLILEVSIRATWLKDNPASKAS
jgi:hypothetical protein